MLCAFLSPQPWHGKSRLDIETSSWFPTRYIFHLSKLAIKYVVLISSISTSHVRLPVSGCNVSFAGSFRDAAHPWPHRLGEDAAHTITLNYCGFILRKSYLQTLPWMQTGNRADLCMPVGIYICTQITCYILPSFNLHLFLLIQHVLSGWDYRREHERAEVLAMQLASPHSQRRQHIINRNFINWWQTAIATWNCLPKPKSGMNEQRSLL